MDDEVPKASPAASAATAAIEHRELPRDSGARSEWSVLVEGALAVNGPMYLRSASDMDVFINDYVPTFFADSERAIVYDGKKAFVSRETFEWMKTASSDELGAMRVMRITEASKKWIPKAPTQLFRWSP